MNENLNLVKLLKDCPKGTEFYSIVYGDVYFDCIDLSRQYPVTIKTSDGGIVEVASNGLHYLEYDGECTFFPSREQRDWSKWHLPFKDGDIIFTRAKFICAKDEYEHTYISIFKEHRDNKCVVYVGKNLHDDTILYYEHKDNFVLCDNSQILEERLATNEEKQFLFKALKECGYSWNFENKTLEKLNVPKFKDGDVVTYENQIAIFKKYISEDSGLAECYVFLDIALDIGIDEGGKYYVKDFATKEEKQKLFDAIKAKGYRWDSEKKKLEKITDVKESRFHPKKLEPFDKVLVKQHERMPWCADFYSYYDEDDDYVACTGEVHYDYCIPYNEETKHLTGTVEDAPGFYRYWED